LVRLDALADHAAVELDLRFARAAAQPMPPAGAPGGPAAHQARAQVLQAGQFHLQLAFVAAGALGKDVENQRGAVGPARPGALQIALLRRAQRLVEDDAMRPPCVSASLDLVSLAAADEQRRIGRLALAGDARHRLSPAVCASRPSSSSSGRNGGAQIHTDQHGRAVAVSAPEATQLRRCEEGGSRKAAAIRRLQPSGGSPGWKVDRAARHDGGDRVLVDHLGDGVAQQHHVLVEGFDLALQLDAVDQVDRHRHMLLAQQVQEGVL
jgi:hypothetical protein